MNIGQIKRTHLSYLIISITLLFGCSSYMEFPINLSIKSDRTDKIPLRVGLCMDRKFKEYAPLMYNIEYHTNVYGKFGEALTKGAESMTNKAFREVVIVDNIDQAASKGVNVVIIPEIDSITIVEAPASVKVKWTIRDVNGKVLYMNTFVGEVKEKDCCRLFKNYCARAIEDHFNKAFDGITKNKWWEGIATY